MNWLFLGVNPAVSDFEVRLNPVQSLIMTVQQHILLEQRRFPSASGEFSWLLSGITLAAKMIEAKVKRAGLVDILGEHGAVNVQGEAQQKLDVYANDALLHCLSLRESIGILASEENERPIAVRHESPNAKYAVIFDPLDGSSNIDVNITVGTTFSVLKRPEGDKASDPTDWVLQPGKEQVAAGYVVYGPSTMMVYTVGHGTHGFTLDPAIGAFVLSHPNMRIPKQGKVYSVNEAYRDTFPAPYQRYIERLRTGALGHRYASRYVGSMIADIHRTLLKGGVFLYPPTTDFPNGKLRLLYEANPMAMIVENAGGVASDGRQSILDLEPTSVHQRTPLVIGGEVEMAEFARTVMQELDGK